MKSEWKIGSTEVLRRVVPPLTIWAVGKLLEAPSVRAATKEIDRRAERQKRQAVRAVQSAGRNALSHGVLLAASVTAFALGAALLTKALQKR